MERITLRINGKPYEVGCEAGGEEHLRALGERVDAKAREAGLTPGGGESRALLTAALMLADDLHVAHEALAAAEGEAEALRAALKRREAEAVAALNRVAERLDALAPE